MDLEDEVVEESQGSRSWKEFFTFYRAEVLTAGVSLAFLGGIFVAVAVADIPVYKGMRSIYRSISGSEKLGTGNKVLDCRRKKNKSSPYCQDWRARQKSTWRGIMRHGGAESPPAFSLHGGE